MSPENARENFLSIPARVGGFIGRRARSGLNRWLVRRRLGSTAHPQVMLGAANTSQEGWIATDSDTIDVLDFDSWRSAFGGRKARSMLAEHVWEHLDAEQGVTAARLCRLFLESGGRLRVAVPDGLFPDERYIAEVRPGGSGSGADDHKLLYTYETLRKTFADAGFEVRLLEFFDEAGVFHVEPWDVSDGLIQRSARFDRRNAGGRLAYTSIILDATNPA